MEMVKPIFSVDRIYLRKRIQYRRLACELKGLKNGYITIFIDPDIFKDFVQTFSKTMPDALVMVTEDVENWATGPVPALFRERLKKTDPIFQLINCRATEISDVTKLRYGITLDYQSDIIYSISENEEVVSYQKLK